MVGRRSARVRVDRSCWPWWRLLLAACGSGTKSSGPTTTTDREHGAPRRRTAVVEDPRSGRDRQRRSRSASRSSTSSASSRTSTTRASTSTRSTTRSSTTSTRTAASRAARSCPIYKTFCPIVPAPALALCTTFTEDDHVFAVLGDFVDLTGQAQPCIANQHKTILFSFQLTQGEHRLRAGRDDDRVQRDAGATGRDHARPVEAGRHAQGQEGRDPR